MSVTFTYHFPKDNSFYYNINSDITNRFSCDRCQRMWMSMVIALLPLCFVSTLTLGVNLR